MVNSRFCFIFFISAILAACTSKAPEPSEEGTYKTIDGILYQEGQPIHIKGVNALHSFGLENMSLLEEWQVKVAREFIGNLREQPIDGEPIQAANGAWLHPLQQIVERNRESEIITILCPFGWVYPNGEQLLFTGLNPTDQDFIFEYESKMREIARHFAGQDDVWIEVWNEPYAWNNSNNYSHELWLNDMQEIINNLRSVNGFSNMIVVPGNEQGQSEDAIISKGKQLLNQFDDLIFDLHAYEKWLNNQSKNEIEARLLVLKNQEFPLLIGEVGIKNVGDLMEPSPFLEVAEKLQIHTLAWLWKREANDQSALLTEQGQPNNLNNNNWGTTFLNFLAQ